MRTNIWPDIGSLFATAKLARYWFAVRDGKIGSPVRDLSETGFSVKFPAGPGEATENHFTSRFASGGWGYPRPPLTEMEDLRATVTDALQSTTFRLSELGLAQCEDSFPTTKPKGP